MPDGGDDYDEEEGDDQDLMMKIQQDIEDECPLEADSPVVHKKKKKRSSKKEETGRSRYAEDEAERSDEDSDESSMKDEDDDDNGFINDDGDDGSSGDDDDDEAKEIGKRRDFEKKMMEMRDGGGVESSSEEEELDGEDRSAKNDDNGDDEEDEMMKILDEEGEDSSFLEDTSDELYNDPRNSNNMSRSMKVVDPCKFARSSCTDGSTYVFISEAEGPMLSSMSKLQILLLLHIINSPIHKKHIAETSKLKPTFNKSDGILEKLLEEVDFGQNQYERSGTEREDLERSIGRIPHKAVCDYEEDGTMDNTKDVSPVSVGEILVSPVTVTYELSDDATTTTTHKKTYWLVMLKTKRCYDFAGHLSSILAWDEDIMPKMRKIHEGLGKTGLSQYLHWITELSRKVLLYNYKFSPNVNSFLKMKDQVSVDPIKRFREIARPDSIDVMCNIYEIYRAMVYGLGPRARNVCVSGFSDGEPFTKPEDEYNYKKSVQAQRDWRIGFKEEKERIQKYEDELKKAGKIRDSGEREKRLAELETEDCGTCCNLPAPIGWPIVEEGMVVDCGLPKLDLIMQVDISDFTYGREQSFQSFFGDLPARSTFELTGMLYKTTTTLSAATDSLPRSIFMGVAEIISEYDRVKKFIPAENTLDAFFTAGYYAKQFINVMKVIKLFPVPSTKLDLYNEYMERSQHQFKSLVLNGNLHSTHTQFAAGYIDKVDGYVCQDLRKLVNEVFGCNLFSSSSSSFDQCGGGRFEEEENRQREEEEEEEEDYDEDNDMEDRDFADDVQNVKFWEIMCPSTFVASNWMFEDMRRRHNEKFFLMTPQNLKICNDTALSSIMYRLGQHNGWTYIGMPTVVCDSACKLRVRIGTSHGLVPETRKKPSAGLDLSREALDSMRTSHMAYMGGGASSFDNVNDDSRITQLKRTTPNGIQTGFALFVNGQLERAPDNELARDCAMPEGPGGDFEALCQLLAGIPRDGEHNSELWTTVDKDKTNVRAKAVSKLIVGFSLYLILCAKNFQYCNKGEARYCDFLIVCNVMCSSAPPDLQGITMRGEEEYDSFENAERAVDKGVSCRGVIGNSVNEKNTKKGDKPGDVDQKLWAPLHYFCYWIAGISVGMMNKMASWNMLVDYGFKEISDYLYCFEKTGLKCLINEVDHANCSRYYESYLCRCIADTTLKKTFMGMVRNDTASKAVFDATRSLSYEAIHLSMLPVLHERLVSRLIQFEPLLGMATIGLCLNVPVVPIESLLQFFDGQRVESIEDFELIKKFYHECSAKKMFMNRSAVVDSVAGGEASRSLSPYITCSSDVWDSPNGPLREKVNTNGQAAGGGNNNNNGGGGSENNKKLGTSEFLQPIAKKLYAANEKVLNSSALVREFISFFKCVESLQRPYDMKEFLGEELTSKIDVKNAQNMKFQMQSVQAPRSSEFPETSMESSDKPDPILVVAPRSGDVFCICVHAPSMLLWFSIMGRPRRDNGIVVEAAHNLVKLAMTKIPKSIFPYDVVPMTRLDHITKGQVLMDLRPNSSSSSSIQQQQRIAARKLLQPREHETLIRYKSDSGDFRMSCEGRGRSKALEDEMYMRSVYMISKDVGCAWNEVPIHKWKLTLDLSFGVTYPFIRYGGGGGGSSSSSAARKNGGVDRNHSSSSFPPSFVRSSMGKFKSNLVGYLFMNPSRRSAIFYTLPTDVYQDYMSMTPEELEEEEWKPHCALVHEFSVSPLKIVKNKKKQQPAAAEDVYTRVGTMDEAIENIFSMGFGPCPFYRRTGVLVLSSPEIRGDEDSSSPSPMMIGCIVSHSSAHGHGCLHCNTTANGSRCYLCPHNPFHEVYFGKGSYEDELLEAKRSDSILKTVRMLPIKASECVIPIGTKVLLSIHSLELLSLVGGDIGKMKSSNQKGKKRPRYRFDITGAPKKVPRFFNNSASAAEGDMIRRLESNDDDEDHGDSPLRGEEEAEDPSQYIHAVVDICRNFNPVEGMAFIRIKVVQGKNRNTVDSRGLFVKPGDLRMPDSIIESSASRIDDDEEREAERNSMMGRREKKVRMESIRTHVEI